MQTTYTTPQAARIIGIKSGTLHANVHRENFQRPAQDAGHRYQWTREDIERAAAFVNKTPNWDALEQPAASVS